MVDGYFKVNAVGLSGCSGVLLYSNFWGNPGWRLSSAQEYKILVGNIARRPLQQNQAQLSFAFHRNRFQAPLPNKSPNLQLLGLLEWNTLYLHTTYTLLPIVFKSSLITYNTQYNMNDV